MKNGTKSASTVMGPNLVTAMAAPVSGELAANFEVDETIDEVRIQETLKMYAKDNNYFGFINLVETYNYNHTVLELVKYERIKLVIDQHNTGSSGRAQKIYAYLKLKVDFSKAYETAFFALLSTCTPYKTDKILKANEYFGTELAPDRLQEIVRTVFQNHLKRGNPFAALYIRTNYGTGINLNDILKESFRYLVQRGFITSGYGKYGLGEFVKAFQGIDWPSLYNDHDIKDGFLVHINDQENYSNISDFAQCYKGKTDVYALMSDEQAQHFVEYYFANGSYHSLVNDKLLLCVKDKINLPQSIRRIYKETLAHKSDTAGKTLDSLYQGFLKDKDLYPCSIERKDYLSEDDIKQYFLYLLTQHEGQKKSKTRKEKFGIGVDFSNEIKEGAKKIIDSDYSNFSKTKSLMESYGYEVDFTDIIIDRYRAAIKKGVSSPRGIENLTNLLPGIDFESFLEDEDILGYFKARVGDQDSALSVAWFQKYKDRIDFLPTIQDFYKTQVKSFDDYGAARTKSTRGNIIKLEAIVEQSDITAKVDRGLKNCISEHGYYNYHIHDLIPILERYCEGMDLSSEIKKIYSQSIQFGDLEYTSLLEEKFVSIVDFSALASEREVRMGFDCIVEKYLHKFVVSSGQEEVFVISKRIEKYGFGVDFSSEIIGLIDKAMRYVQYGNNKPTSLRKIYSMIQTIGNNIDCSKIVQTHFSLMLQDGKTDIGEHYLVNDYYQLFAQKYDLSEPLQSSVKYWKDRGNIMKMDSIMEVFGDFIDISSVITKQEAKLILKNAMIQGVSTWYLSGFATKLKTFWGEAFDIKEEVQYCFEYFIVQHDYDVIVNLFQLFPQEISLKLPHNVETELRIVITELVTKYDDSWLKGIRGIFHKTYDFAKEVKQGMESVMTSAASCNHSTWYVSRLQLFGRGLFFDLSENTKIVLQDLFLMELKGGHLNNANGIRSAYGSQVHFEKQTKAGLLYWLTTYRQKNPNDFRNHDSDSHKGLDIALSIKAQFGGAIDVSSEVQNAFRHHLCEADLYRVCVDEAAAITRSTLGEGIDFVPYIRQAVSRCVRAGMIQTIDQIKKAFGEMFDESMIAVDDVKEGFVDLIEKEVGDFSAPYIFFQYFKDTVDLGDDVNACYLQLVRRGKIEQLSKMQNIFSLGGIYDLSSLVKSNDIAQGFIEQVASGRYDRAEKVKEHFSDKLDRDKSIPNDVVLGWLQQNTITLSQLKSFLSEGYLKLLIKKNKDFFKKQFLIDPQVISWYDTVIAFVGEEFAYSTLFANLSFWLNTHDNLLFVERLSEYPKKDRQILFLLVLRPILSTKTFFSEADFVELNKYLGYFDLKEYRDTYGDEPIANWNQFVRQALVHKNNIKIPGFASEKFKQAVSTLIQAPGVNVSFIKNLIEYYATYYGPVYQRRLNDEDAQLVLEQYEGLGLLVQSGLFGNLYFDDQEYGVDERRFFANLEIDRCLCIPDEIASDTVLKVYDKNNGYERMNISDFFAICGLSYGMRSLEKLHERCQAHEITITNQEIMSGYKQGQHNQDVDDEADDDRSYYDDSPDDRFGDRLIRIIEGIDKIDERQIIRPHTLMIPFDPLNQVVLGAIGFHAINQQTVKLIPLFKDDSHLQSIVDLLMVQQKEIECNLTKRRNDLVRLYPHKTDYYQAEFQKNLRNESIVFTENGAVKSFSLGNVTSLVADDEKHYQIIASLYNFIQENNDVCVNVLRALRYRKDKIYSQADLKDILPLLDLCDELFLSEKESISVDQLLQSLAGKELIFASYLLFLGFNNRTRQSNSKELKNGLDQILNTPKYIHRIANETGQGKKTQPSMSFLEGSMTVDDAEKDKILALLTKYGYESAGRFLKVEILPKSDPRGRVCGDYTDCCMPFTSSKNQQYLLREDMAYYVISLVDKDGSEDLIAQSVLVAANPVNLNYSPSEEPQPNSGTDELDFATLAVDNIEIANRALHYRIHIAKAYDMLRDSYRNKKIIIGTTYNDDGGLVTGQCPLQTLKDEPKHGEMEYSDCFGRHSAYVFHDPHGELGVSSYQYFGLQIDSFDSSLLKKNVSSPLELDQVRDLLTYISIGEPDGEGGMSFHDNYSSVILSNGEYQGYIIAADYLSDDVYDALTIEQISLDSSLSKENLLLLLSDYFKRLNIDNNKAIKRIILKSVSTDCVKCIRTITKKIVIHQQAGDELSNPVDATESIN